MTASAHRPGLTWPFWNPRERRVRAGWRIVAMLALYLVATIATMRLVEAALGDRARLAAPVALVVVALLAAWVPSRYLDHRPLRSLGLDLDRTRLRQFGVGVLVGTGLMGGVLVVYLAAGWARVTGWFAAEDEQFLAAFALLVVTYAAVAFLEELLFRGYLITNLVEGFSRGGPGGPQPWSRWQRGLPVAAAVIVSSLVFAHFHGDSLTALDYLHFGLAGVLLAVPYVLTGNLALPIGLHWAFNVGATGLFNVEGDLPAVIRVAVDGPRPWVGEAGLVETIMIAATVPVVVWYLRRSADGRAPSAPTSH
ncbi:MAG TPA: CPBP family intramembrane glutamic endopeptidase [Egicoccus sp.]|nr:CPBP family intramembrane glutamic endopeptidase [Egicoccus sp.]HSK24574.1 CPBP family intramembrane glutamic endopeptidase [Egicoccus sp.]